MNVIGIFLLVSTYVVLSLQSWEYRLDDDDDDDTTTTTNNNNDDNNNNKVRLIINFISIVIVRDKLKEG